MAWMGTPDPLSFKAKLFEQSVEGILMLIIVFYIEHCVFIYYERL